MRELLERWMNGLATIAPKGAGRSAHCYDGPFERRLTAPEHAICVI